MKEIELRIACSLAVLAIIACGSSAPTDFNSPDGTESGGSAGAQQGGNSGASLGGNAGASLSGSGGIASGGSGGSGGTGEGGTGGGGGLGGSGASVQGGAAGTVTGGTTAGGGDASGGSTGARGGTGGSGTVPYACGTLMCIQGRQMCVHTLPAMSAGSHMYQCLEYPDSCTTVDCSCFCKEPMNNPCGSESECMCSGDPGRITVQCAAS